MGERLMTAPKQICPECSSKNVLWREIGIGFGYYICIDCGKMGW